MDKTLTICSKRQVGIIVKDNFEVLLGSCARGWNCHQDQKLHCDQLAPPKVALSSQRAPVHFCGTRVTPKQHDSYTRPYRALSATLTR